MSHQHLSRHRLTHHRLAPRMAPSRHLGGRILVVVAALLAFWIAGGSRATAKEQLRRFVEGLRRRQMHDLAIDYLEQMRESRLVDDETKKLIPYEEGRTLVDQARTMRDVKRRIERLNEATVKFEQFLNSYSDHPLAAAANIELGNVEVERGRTKLELAARPSHAADKQQLRAEAIQHFKKAKKVFNEAKQKFEAELAKFPKLIDDRDKQLKEQRRQARLNLIEAQMLSAMVLFEMAQAYDPGSGDAKQRLSDASEQFQKLYEQYRLKVAGLSARLYQARCQQNLGDLVMALTFYEELLAQDANVPVLRDLIAKALRQAMQCWLDDSQQKFDRAIEEGDKWIRQARPHEAQSPVGLAIRWQTAKAHELRAKAEEDDAARNRDLKAAAAQAAQVARYPGDHQRQAREMAARLRNRDGQQEPATFAEARDQAKAALDAMQVALGRVQIARATGKAKDQIRQFEQQAADARREAIKGYRLALGLRDKETPIEEINQVRYYLCFLDYQSGAFYEAAVLGEFLARRYPESAGARPGAEIAMASYLKAYNQSPADQRAFETRRMVELAQYLAGKWPAEPQAAKAWMILGDLAMRSNDLPRAADYFARIPEDSPLRTEADLKAGQTLWADYLSQGRLDEAERPPKADRERLLSDAEKLLLRGIESMRKEVAKTGKINHRLPEAELALARLYVETSRPGKALKLLERPKDGVLSLVKAGHAAIQAHSLPLEAYKAALRAYVATEQLDKATATMQRLDEVAKKSGGDQAAITRVYVSLGHELEQQVNRLQAEQKNKELGAVLNSFELFLGKISSRGEGNTFGSLRWVAETYYRLAEGLSGSGPQAAKAKAFYQKAVAVYDVLLQRAKSQPGFAPQKGYKDALYIAKAKALRGAGKYKDSLLLIVDVLKNNPRTLQAQIEAAETYQAWAAEKPDLYARAIAGRRVKRDGKQVELWGWAGLATRVQRYPKYRSTYHLGRYRVAECRYRRALKQSDPQKTENLKKAERDIVVTARLDPEMGGREWFVRYDTLLKKIQRALGRKAVGLSAVKNSTAGAPSKARRG